MNLFPKSLNVVHKTAHFKTRKVLRYWLLVIRRSIAHGAQRIEQRTRTLWAMRFGVHDSPFHDLTLIDPGKFHSGSLQHFLCHGVCIAFLIYDLANASIDKHLRTDGTGEVRAIERSPFD